MLGLAKKESRLVSIMLAGTLLAVLNGTLLSPAFPAIMAEFAISSTTVQWLASGYAMVEAVVVPLSAFMLGRFNTRTLFLGSFAIFVVGSLLCSWGPVFSVMLLGRVFQAIATGVAMPMSMTLNILVFPREKRGTAMGLMGLIVGFAPAVGPTLSGVLIDYVGWHILFLLVAFLGVLLWIVGAVNLKNFGDFVRVPLDLRSVLYSSVGMLALLYSASSFTSSDQVLLLVGLALVGVFFLYLFVKRQGKLEIPMLRFDILRSRRFRLQITTGFAMNMAFSGLIVVVPLYIQTVLGHGATISGLVTLPGSIVSAIMAMVCGRLFDKYGVRKLALIGSFVTTAAAVSFCFMGLYTAALLFAVLNAFLTLGTQFLQTPVNTWGINSLDNSVVQHANALSNTMNQVANSFGPALVVSLTALAPRIFSAADPVVQNMWSTRIGFIAIAAIYSVVIFIAVFALKDRSDDAQKVGKAVSLEEEGDRSIVVAMVMNPNPSFVRATDEIRDAVNIFKDRATSGVPVVNENYRVVGFISDGDIMGFLGKVDMVPISTYLSTFAMPEEDSDVRELISDMMSLNVMELATKKAVCVSSEMPIDEAMSVLAEKRIKKVPVVDSDGVLVGTLSRTNVIQKLMGGFDQIEDEEAVQTAEAAQTAVVDEAAGAAEAEDAGSDS